MHLVAKAIRISHMLNFITIDSQDTRLAYASLIFWHTFYVKLELQR